MRRGPPAGERRGEARVLDRVEPATDLARVVREDDRAVGREEPRRDDVVDREVEDDALLEVRLSCFDREPWKTEFWKMVPKWPATASWVKVTVSSST